MLYVQLELADGGTVIYDNVVSCQMEEAPDEVPEEGDEDREGNNEPDNNEDENTIPAEVVPED